MHVVMACRNLKKCEAARTTLTKPKLATCMFLDLASLPSVKSFATDFAKYSVRLDVLLLNGGIIAPHEIIQPFNIEKTFLVNYLSHFLLTKLLLPLLKHTSNLSSNNFGARIISVSSDAHAYSYKEGILGSALSIDPINDPSLTNVAQNYAQAKLANIMLTTELNNQLDENSKHVYANAAHPGLVATNLFLNSFLRLGFSRSTASVIQYWFENILTTFGIAFDLKEGAMTQVYLCLSMDVVNNNYKGLFFVPIAGIAPADAFVSNRTLTRNLYELSNRLVEEYL